MEISSVISFQRLFQVRIPDGKRVIICIIVLLLRRAQRVIFPCGQIGERAAAVNTAANGDRFCRIGIIYAVKRERRIGNFVNDDVIIADPCGRNARGNVQNDKRAAVGRSDRQIIFGGKRSGVRPERLFDREFCRGIGVRRQRVVLFIDSRPVDFHRSGGNIFKIRHRYREVIRNRIRIVLQNLIVQFIALRSYVRRIVFAQINDLVAISR